MTRIYSHPTWLNFELRSHLKDIGEASHTPIDENNDCCRYIKTVINDFAVNYDIILQRY